MRGGPSRHRRTDAVLVGLAVATALPSLLGFLGGTWPGLDLLAHFRLHYALSFCIPITAALIARRWRPALLAALLALPNALALGAAWAGPLPRSSADADLSVVALNVLTSNRDFDTALAYLLAADADVIVLQEVDAAWLDALRPLHARYPHRLEAPRRDNFGIALFGRMPWSDAQIIPLGSVGLPAAWATFALPAGPVGLLAVHPVPPIGDAYRRVQSDQYDALARHVRAARHPLVVVGDLNATPWGARFRSLTTATSLTRSNTPGLHATWPAALGPFGIPLDHALHTPGLEPLAYSVGPDVGSDHRPVLVHYRVGAAE